MNRDIQARTYEIFRYELEATSSPACFFISLMPFSCTQRIIRLLRPPVLYLQRLVPLISDFWQGCLNTFVPNATFLYPLKASESLTVFWCFQGAEKRWIGDKWVNYSVHNSWVAGMRGNANCDLSLATEGPK